MKRVVAIIQARMGSRRIPGKVMVDINGHPLIWHIIQRARAADVDEVVLATTIESSDDPLCEYMSKLGIPTFRGPTNDLYLRFLEAAEGTKADVILQLFGDSPCIDPQIMKGTLDGLKDSHCCYSVGYPRGLNAYAFTTDRWRQVAEICQAPASREFHHQYLSEGGNTYPIAHWDIHGFNFCVDTPEDLEYIRDAYRDLGNYFFCDTLVKWAM